MEKYNTELTQGNRETWFISVLTRTAFAFLWVAKQSAISKFLIIEIIEIEETTMNLVNFGIKKNLVGAIATTTTITSIIIPTVAQTYIGELQRDHQVTITGEITNIWDDEFKLSDGTGEIRVDTDDEKAINLSVGEKVTVVGKYDDDDFDAFIITRQDGTVINIRSISEVDDDD